LKNNWFYSFTFTLLFVVFFGWTFGTGRHLYPYPEREPGVSQNKPMNLSQVPSNSPTPDPSQAVNLPYVQQNAPTPTATLSPEDDGYVPPQLATEAIPGTPTSTPIPIQTWEFNIPIVIGVVVIIAIIMLAWGLFGRFKI
jgi:hypothetical protein